MNSRARYEPAALPGSVYIDTSYLANLSCFLGSFASVLCASVSRSVCSAGSFCRFCPRPDSVRPGRNGERERSSIKWDTENVTSARKGENGNNKKKRRKKKLLPPSYPCLRLGLYRYLRPGRNVLRADGGAPKGRGFSKKLIHAPAEDVIRCR